MKKITSYSLVLVAVTALLAGCWSGSSQQSSTPAQPQEIVETREIVPPEIQADTELSTMSELNDSDELDSIQKELDETKILEEEFSDL